MLEEASAHFYKQFKIMSRRMGEIAWIAIHPLIFILSLGILAYFVSEGGAGPETMLFVFAGVIVWNIYDVSQRATSFGITLDIWADSLKHTFTGSSSLAGFIVGNASYGLFSSVLVLMITGILAVILFGFNIFLAGFYLINLFFVFIFATGLALVINSLMVTKGDKYMSLIWILTGIIMIFSGVYYPIDILPGPVQAVSLAVPTTHSIMSLRAALGFSPGLANPELAIGAILSVAYFALGVLVFRWAIKRSKVTGVITRY